MKINADYWEIRKGNSEKTHIQVINGKVETVNSAQSKGISVRVLNKGSWGFAHSSNGDVEVLAKKAVKMARILGKGTNEVSPSTALKKNFKIKFKINPDDIDPALIVSRFKKKHREVINQKSKGTTIKSTAFDYHTVKKNLLFQNSEGSSLKQNLMYTAIVSDVGAKKGTIEEHYKTNLGKQAGFEAFSGFDKIVKDAKTRARELCLAKLVKGGTMQVVCDPVLVDVLIHEAFGHATEADIVLKGESCLGNKLNKSIAGDDVSIVDDPSLSKLWGSYFFDEEGTPASKTFILKKGILNSYLHSRETAAKFECESTGNGRAESLGFLPVVRMSNTNLQKGSASENELYEGIKNGLFLGGSGGGQVDTAKGNYQFNAKYGYVIKNGEITTPVKGVSLSGNTLTMLKNISLIGKKIEEGMPGMCGKQGQSVPVLGVNPKIRLENAIVGGK